MQALCLYQVIAILLIVACLLFEQIDAGVASSEIKSSKKRSDEQTNNKKHGIISETDLDSRSKFQLEAQQMLSIIKNYQVCNINWLKYDSNGKSIVQFDPMGCKRGHERRFSMNELLKRPFSKMSSRGLLQNITYCIINFLQQLATLRFRIPGICCRLPFPISIIFFFGCSGNG